MTEPQAQSEKAQGRWAVITGASGGIGEATAKALAADGWRVLLAARRQEQLRRVAGEIGAAGGVAEFAVVDVSDPASVSDFAERVRQVAGAVDLLVNNAGGARGLEPIVETDPADWRWMYEANVLGTLNTTRALYEQLKAAPAGQVINVVSMAGRAAYRNGAGYNAAKFGQTAMTDVMRMEFAADGVRVCQVDPGRVATEFSLNRFKGDQQRAEEVYADKLNLVAEDIAEAIRWIADRPRHMDVESIMIKPLDQV
ncbi:SDR family oxidoreductase [Corynebacterium heidelbergense]|uniref:SDR family oxidoreductase n=1 Tax=Corynebacterium heidelbergense TaxID=2055947 RepID=A0A364V3R1_9CORY|nr:SDR family oxidoreductase [Corynebacterium heidelbergense]RAV31280.1 SDR family oxidoreductase [Corynebacterium heidelbergense]